MINRKLLMEQSFKLYFRDLDGRHPISTIMEKAPLVVDAGTSLGDLSRILVVDGEKSVYEGFIATRSRQDAGMGRAQDRMEELAPRKQAHLYHVPHHDMLTGLPNRQLFPDRLRQAVSRAGHDRSPWRYCSSTKTTSRRSTIRWGTSPGTSSGPPRRAGSRAVCNPPDVPEPRPQGRRRRRGVARAAGLLREGGCDMTQSHLYSLEVPAEEVEWLLRDGAALRHVKPGGRLAPALRSPTPPGD